MHTSQAEIIKLDLGGLDMKSLLSLAATWMAEALSGKRRQPMDAPSGAHLVAGANRDLAIVHQSMAATHVYPRY